MSIRKDEELDPLSEAVEKCFMGRDRFRFPLETVIEDVLLVEFLEKDFRPSYTVASLTLVRTHRETRN